ncbi:MAG: transposase [Bdellovibrionales bacterium]|nr:transposase [Bdellovibrionales bacterium]
MPRKKLILTHEFPYHIYARSNNKEWFYLPIDECWRIFSKKLNEASFKFKFQVHEFVLMNNHYHMVATASEQFPVPKVMEWLQRSVNREINDNAGRINHLFGGPYRASLIKSEASFFYALKYVLRNPVDAGVVSRVEDYSYSTLVSKNIARTSLITGISSLVPRCTEEWIRCLNEDESSELKIQISKSLKRTQFEIPQRFLKWQC